jgi:hypothetical protein
VNHALLIFIRCRLQQLVQTFQVAHPWHGDKMVAPELTAFALDPALLMALAGRAELCPEAPVRAEGDEPSRLFPLPDTQATL